MDNKSQPSAKFQQFADELNALLDRYQYSLRPTLSFNLDGITPHLQIDDKLPPKEEILNETNPVNPAPVETPPNPEPIPTPEPGVPSQPQPETPAVPETPPAA